MAGAFPRNLETRFPGPLERYQVRNAKLQWGSVILSEQPKEFRP